MVKIILQQVLMPKHYYDERLPEQHRYHVPTPTAAILAGLELNALPASFTAVFAVVFTATVTPFLIANFTK